MHYFCYFGLYLAHFLLPSHPLKPKDYFIPAAKTSFPSRFIHVNSPVGGGHWAPTRRCNISHWRKMKESARATWRRLGSALRRARSALLTKLSRWPTRHGWGAYLSSISSIVLSTSYFINRIPFEKTTCLCNGAARSTLYSIRQFFRVLVIAP